MSQEHTEEGAAATQSNPSPLVNENLEANTLTGERTEDDETEESTDED